MEQPTLHTSDLKAPTKLPGGPGKRRRWLRSVLFLAAYLAFVFFAPVADWLILHPSTEFIDTTRLERRQIPLPSGEFVEAWVARSSAVSASGTPKAFILSFIGNAARAELTAPYYDEDWRAHPVEIWSVNYPGYGGSPGSARLSSIGPVAIAAYDAVHKVAGNRPILVEGRSLGSAAALHVAAKRKVAGCILHNPPPLKQLILGRFGWWNLWMLAGPVALTLPSDLDSVSNAGIANAPAIFVLAGDDEVVPPQYQEKVADAYAGPKQVVRATGASHNDRVSGEALKALDAAQNWLWAQAVDGKGP